jgi:hypothetical protein
MVDWQSGERARTWGTGGSCRSESSRSGVGSRVEEGERLKTIRKDMCKMDEDGGVAIGASESVSEGVSQWVSEQASKPWPGGGGWFAQTPSPHAPIDALDIARYWSARCPAIHRDYTTSICNTARM